MDRLFVGRHGEVDEDGALTADGQNHATEMAQCLYGYGFNRSGIILSSKARRAILTAEVVKDNLGLRTLVRSKYANLVGLHPEPVKDAEDLRTLVTGVLDACNVRHVDTSVVMVAHLPLVKAVTGQEPQHGQVYEVPLDWQNPTYQPDLAILLKHPDLWIE